VDPPFLFPPRVFVSLSDPVCVLYFLRASLSTKQYLRIDKLGVRLSVLSLWMRFFASPKDRSSLALMSSFRPGKCSPHKLRLDARSFLPLDITPLFSCLKRHPWSVGTRLFRTDFSSSLPKSQISMTKSCPES